MATLSLAAIAESASEPKIGIVDKAAAEWRNERRDKVMTTSFSWRDLRKGRGSGIRPWASRNALVAFQGFPRIWSGKLRVLTAVDLLGLRQFRRMICRLRSQIEQVKARTVVKEVVHMNNSRRVSAPNDGIGGRLVATRQAALFVEMK